MGLVRFLRDRRQRRRMAAIAKREYLGGVSAYLEVKERLLQEVRRGRRRLSDLEEAQEATQLWPRFEAETDEGFLDALAKCVPQRFHEGETDDAYDLRLRTIFGHLRARVDGPLAPAISSREVEQARLAETVVATMRPSAPAPARVRQTSDTVTLGEARPAAPAPPTPTPTPREATKAERRAARRALWARGVRSPSPADLSKEALRLRTEVPSHVA